MKNLLTLAVTNTDIFPAHSSGGLKGLLISFLIAVVVLLIIAGLVWMIERYIHPLPDPIKLVLAVVLVIAVVIWGVSNFM